MKINLQTPEGWKLFENLEIDSQELAKRNIVIGYGCNLGYGCKLGNECKLGNGCNLGNECKLGNECLAAFVICIIGSKHTVNYAGNEMISIGCKMYGFDWWLENYEKVGKRENYSESQIEEYKKYIDLIISVYQNENISSQA